MKMSLYYVVRLKGDNRAEYITGPFKSFNEAYSSVEYQNNMDIDITIMENEIEVV